MFIWELGEAMENKNLKLNLALIGAGGIGKIWASAFKKIKGATLRAVVDLDLRRAADLAKEFQNCRAEKDFRAVLKEDAVDAVVVATPHKWLASISGEALSASKQVLCEKPAGMHSADIKKNIAIAGKKKLVYMVGFNHRYHAGFLEARKRLESGEIGNTLFIRARYGFGGRPGYEKEWRFDKKISGGGELIDQGVHMIDLARWFLGEFKDVMGFAEKLFWHPVRSRPPLGSSGPRLRAGETSNGVEDNGFALLRTKDQKVAQIHVSWTNWKWIHSFEIYGTKGYLVIEGLDQRYNGPERLTIGRRDPEFAKPPVEEVMVFKNEQKEDSFVRELEAFVGAIRGKYEIPTGKDAYEVLRIVEKIYKSNR